MVRFRPWINILTGLWAFISGFSVTMLHPVNIVVIGALITVFGFWTYEKEWQGIVNGLIGLWLILSVFAPALMVPVNLWISGFIVVVLAIWRLISVSSHHPHLPEHPAMG